MLLESALWGAAIDGAVCYDRYHGMLEPEREDVATTATGECCNPDGQKLKPRLLDAGNGKRLAATGYDDDYGASCTSDECWDRKADMLGLVAQVALTSGVLLESYMLRSIAQDDGTREGGCCDDGDRTRRWRPASVATASTVSWNWHPPFLQLATTMATAGDTPATNAGTVGPVCWDRNMICCIRQTTRAPVLQPSSRREALANEADEQG